MPKVCRFRFREGMTRETIETQIAAAILAAECIFGEPQVRITAGYSLSEDASVLALDTSTEVGEYIARVFAWLIIPHAGEEGYTLEMLCASREELERLNSAEFWIRWICGRCARSD